MNVIKAKPIPKTQVNIDDLIATFCYYFSQYTFTQAEKLPYKRIVKALKTVEKQKARDFMELTQIMAAPHSKNMRAVKRLIDHYKQIID